MALQLKRAGIPQVRPLAGGFEAWRDLGFPTEPVDEIFVPDKFEPARRT